MKRLIVSMILAISSQASALEIDVAECLRLTEKFYNGMTYLEIREYDELKTCVSEMMSLKIQLAKEVKNQSRGEK